MDGEFLVASGDTPEPFQAVDTSLDDVSPTIGIAVELFPVPFFVGLVGDDLIDVMFLQPITNPISRVSFVAGQFVWLLWPCGYFFQQRHKMLGFMLLPGANADGQRCTEAVTDQMQLRAEATLAST